MLYSVVMALPPEQAAKLAFAECLEQDAAAERVEYYAGLIAAERLSGVVLDLGCGNGYAVDAWKASGARAVGVDNSRYRFSRWRAERRARSLVLADAARLPFRAGAFAVVTSSGMIEHVGVAESTPPYRVEALADRESRRAGVVREALRVVASQGVLYLDCPNGQFPVDFWHGDRVGAFRLHGVPDVLLPTLADARSWVVGTGAKVTLTPIGRRLRFRQIAGRWWGRLFRMPVRAILGALDRLVGRLPDEVLSPFVPFLVLRVQRDEGSGGTAERGGFFAGE